MEKVINSELEMQEMNPSELSDINGGGILDDLFEGAGYLFGKALVFTWSMQKYNM